MTDSRYSYLRAVGNQVVVTQENLSGAVSGGGAGIMSNARKSVDRIRMSSEHILNSSHHRNEFGAIKSRSDCEIEVVAAPAAVNNTSSGGAGSS